MGAVDERMEAINGVRLWTARQGSGPPLVLLHGGPGLWDDCDDLAAMVDDLVEVHRYDQRGSGRSEAAPPYDVATFIADLEALRVRWGHRRWIVGGHSAGANLALAYAAAHPERVTALLYVSGTGLINDWREECHANEQARRTTAQQARHAELSAQLKTSPQTWTPELDREYCTLAWMTDFADRKHALERTRARLRPYGPNYQVNTGMNADWRRLLGEGRLADAARGIEAPALVLHGLDDPRPPRLAERLAAMLPNPRLALIARCGHWPWLEQPDAVRARLRAFLAEVAAGRPEDA